MATQLTRTHIITLLKAEKSYLTKEFGVVNIGLFGSFATGQSDRDSDIDLIAELREPRFDHLAGLQVYLEKKISRKIEIVRKGNMANSRFVQRVEKDPKNRPCDLEKISTNRVAEYHEIAGYYFTDFGFSERIKGGHHVFFMEGVEEIINLQPLRGGKAKAYQVKQVRTIILKYKFHKEE